MLSKDIEVLVLTGGWSAERDVSLMSGRAVIEALRGAGYRVRDLEFSPELPRLESINRLLDELEAERQQVVYVAMHGPFGEDGAVQGVLELAEVPYNGSGIIASALGNDKLHAKEIFVANKITTPRYALIRREDKPESVPLPLPVVVKPRALGSSVGVSIVRKENEFGSALESAFAYDQDVLVETYIKGREIHAGILDGKALPLVEVVCSEGFYDYAAKYNPGQSEHRVPAPLPKKQSEACQRAAEKAYRALGCCGAARVDIIAEDTGTIYVLEVNTLPGMTPTSLLPEAARETGLSFVDLVLHELEGARSRFFDRSKGDRA